MKKLEQSERIFKPHIGAVAAFEKAMGRKYTKFDLKRELFFETILTALMGGAVERGKLNSEMLKVFSFEIAAKLAEKQGIKNTNFFTETYDEKKFTDVQFLHAVIDLLEVTLGIVFDEKEPGDDEQVVEVR